MSPSSRRFSLLVREEDGFRDFKFQSLGPQARLVERLADCGHKREAGKLPRRQVGRKAAAIEGIP